MASHVRQQRDPRVSFEQPVWVGVRDATGPIRRLWASNLSKGGMFVRMAEPLALGEELLVALEGSQEILPLAEAIVVWQRPVNGSLAMDAQAGVGLAFTAYKPSADALLSTALHAAAREEPPLDSADHAEPPTPAIPSDPPPGSPAAVVLGPVAEPTPSPRAGTPPALYRHQPEVFWTELFVPNRPRIRVRALHRELRFDFGDQRVAGVVKDGNRVVVSLRD